MSSRQPALSSAPPSQLQLPTSGDSSQGEHGTVPQECPSPGSDMDMGYGYDDSSEEDAVTERDGAMVEDVSLEAQIRKQWGITTTPEVVLRRCDSVSTASQADDVSLETQIRKQSGIIATPLVVLRRFDSVSTASQAGNSNTSSSPTLVKAKRGGESGRPPLVKTRLSKTASVKTDGHFQDRECIAKTDGDFQKDEDSVASMYKQKEAICKRVTRYTRCGMTDLETAADNAKDSPTAVKSVTNNFSISCGSRSTRLRSAVAEFVAKNTRPTSAVADFVAKSTRATPAVAESVAKNTRATSAVAESVAKSTRTTSAVAESVAKSTRTSAVAEFVAKSTRTTSSVAKSARTTSAVAESVAKSTRTSAVAESVAKSTRVTSESVKLVVDDRSLEHSADEMDGDCTGEIVTKNPQKTPESNNRDEDWNPEHHSLATEDHKRRSGKNTRLASTGRKPVIHDGSKEPSADEGDADSTEKIAVKNRCKKPASDDSDEDWVPKKHKHATDDCRKSVGENTRVTFADDKSALNKRSMEHSGNEADSDCSEEIPAKQQRKKKSAENDSDEDWIPDDHATDDDDGVSDGEFSEPQQIRLNSYVQEFTIEEFMTGKVPILIGHSGGPTSPTAHYKYYSHYTCEKCYKVFVSKADYQSHVEDHRQECKDDSKPERTGPDPESLQILEEIKERLVFCCPHCSRAFTSKIHHRLHVRTHNYTTNSDGSYSCNFCGRSFSQETLVYCHQKGRKGRTSVCTKCGVNLASRCQIRAHMKTHKEGTGRSHCKICGEAFDGLRKVEINRHMRSHESGNVVCSVCGKSLKRSSLTNHMLTHSNTTPHTCSVCNKSFRHKASLEHHQTLHGEKTIQCEICGMYFRRMALLKKHKAFRHQGEGVKCQHCGKILCDKSHLNHHIRVVHKKIKPYVCSVCGVALAYKDHLISHMRIHTGEKPYQCPHCPSMFARKDYLKLHIRTHTGEKPYRCQDCGQRFICRSSLTLHRKTHHKDKTFPCSVCGEEFPLQSSVDYHCHLKHGATYTFLKDCWQPAENPVASQDCGQPAENPVASQDCGQPAENPVASQDCGQPAENPVASQDCGQPAENSVASQDCGQPAENAVASQDCGQPAENPVASQDCGQPAENSAASQDCGQPAENRAAPGYCVLPTENWATPRDCVLPTENWATPRDCVLPTENWATPRDCVLPTENWATQRDCVLPAENPVA